MWYLKKILYLKIIQYLKFIEYMYFCIIQGFKEEEISLNTAGSDLFAVSNDLKKKTNLTN